MGISQSTFFAIQFIGSVLLARLLDPYEMGIYAVALALTSVLSILQTSGLNGFVIRQPNMTPELVSSAFTINAIQSSGIALLVFLGSFGAARFLHADAIRQVMQLLAMLPLIAMFEFLPATILEREANFKAIAVIGSGRTLITQGISVYLAYRGFSYFSLVYGQIAGALFSTAIYNIVGRRHVAFRLRLDEWGAISKFGLQMLAISGVKSVGAKLGDVLLARFVSVSALGLYGRATGINNLIQNNVYLVIVRVLFVDIAAQIRAGNSLRDRYIATVDILTALLWPAFAGLAVLSAPFISLVYGIKWVAAAAPLALLCISSIIIALVSLSWELFVARQETSRQTRIEFISTGFSLAAFAVGCHFGLLGAAFARVMGAIFEVAIYYRHLNRMTETTAKDFLPIYARSAGLTFAAVLPVAAIMTFHHWSYATSISQLILAILAGAGLWLAGLILFNHPLASELRHLCSRVTRPAAPNFRK